MSQTSELHPTQTKAVTNDSILSQTRSANRFPAFHSTYSGIPRLQA